MAQWQNTKAAEELINFDAMDRLETTIRQTTKLKATTARTNKANCSS